MDRPFTELVFVTHQREEQRDKLRREESPADAVSVVRGGRDTLDKLRVHARRTHRAWSLDGAPIFGVSVFCALDDIGPASLDGLLAGRLLTYRFVHVTTVGTLRTAGFLMVPTGSRPHYTVTLGTDDDEELGRFLAALGPPQDNRYYFRARSRPRGARR